MGGRGGGGPGAGEARARRCEEGLRTTVPTRHPLPHPPPCRRVHGGAGAPGRHRRAPPRCPGCRRARGAVAMGRPFWTAAALGLVLAACQRCSGFYLPGVAPQDYAKVRAGVVALRRTPPAPGGLAQRLTGCLA